VNGVPFPSTCGGGSGLVGEGLHGSWGNFEMYNYALDNADIAGIVAQNECSCGVSGTPTSTRTPSPTSTPTPTSSPTSTSTPSQTPSRTSTSSPTPTKTPSTTPSTARIELLVVGSIPVGNAWTRTASEFSEIAFSFQFRVNPGNKFIGPNNSNFTTFYGIPNNPPYLEDFSFADLMLLYERDTNCGQQPGETPCSCESSCGSSGNPDCCANFHRATLQEFDGDGLAITGFSPWSVSNSHPTYNFKVVCNGATIPHLWIGIRGSNTVHYLATDGVTHIPFQNISDTFSTLKPFIPAGTLGDAEKGHGYCLPSYPTVEGFLLEDYRTINKQSSCSRTEFCAASQTDTFSGQTIAFGGCFCDIDCSTNGDCCLSVDACYFTIGATHPNGSTLFAGDGNCHDGLIDCAGQCRGAWAFQAVGDGICDDGRRGIDLNCDALGFNGRADFEFDGGDCACDPGEYITCAGICGSTGPSTGCTCTDMSPDVAVVVCDGITCAPVIPTIFCNGLSEYDVDCPQIVAMANAATLAEARQKVCGLLPDGCTVEIPAFVGDHVCDSGAPYNTQLCNYDNGDCCEASCLATASTPDAIARCGSQGYTCIDPNFNSK
jgi:hypothetical protein